MKQCVTGLHRYRKYCKDILHNYEIKGGIPKNNLEIPILNINND